jgi:hypothetical protein
MAVPAEQVLEDCVTIFPSFRAYWEENGWYFQDESGAYEACGVLLLLTWLIYERLPRVSERQWRRLGALAKQYFDRGEPARGLLGACLLEPLDGPPYVDRVLRYFDRDLLRYYHFSGAS